MPLHINLTSLNDTERLAGELAPLVARGGVILLSGGLGAGKTTLVQALCRGIGVTESVTSPTFDLLHIYHTEGLAVYHVDGYRITDEREWDVLDLPAPGASGTLILAEWGDVLKEWYPTYLEVRLEIDPAMGGRRAELTAAGVEWQAKLQTLDGRGS